MGLPDSGKTTLAKLLAPMFNAVLLNEDEVRKEANDFDLTDIGRSIHTNRMKRLADEAIQNNRNVIADFECTDDERKDFTNESMLKTAEQTSKLLTSTYDTRVEDETFADRTLKIKSPTESISGYDDAYIEDQKRKESGQYNLDDLLMDLPQDTRVKDENIIIPLRKPDGEVKKKYNLLEETNKIMDSLKGERFKTKPVQENVDLDKQDAMLVDAQKQPPKETLGISTPSTEQFQRQTTLPTQVDTQSAIGSYMDESVYNVDQPVTGIKGPPSVISGPQVEPVKRNALETVNTSLKKVFKAF